MRTLFSLIALWAMLSATGCATIVKGRTQRVGISSSPTGAEFQVDGKLGTTPTIVELRRSQDHFIGLRKPGYEEASVTIQSSWSPMTLGNVVLLLAAPLGWVIDYGTGASHNLAPSSVHVTLVRQQ